LEGTGGHTVRNVTSRVAQGNIVVRSDQNQLINVYAASGAAPAFGISGNHNRLTDSIAQCGDFGLVPVGCIHIRGDENRLINNFATSGPSRTSAGFLIIGNNNVLRGNRAIGNDGRGIVVTGTGNILQRNTALANTLDLEDTNGDCTQNTWRQNTFETSDPACIGQSTRESVADMER
jgi:parallel beta-helix repeat protein